MTSVEPAVTSTWSLPTPWRSANASRNGGTGGGDRLASS